MFSQFSAVLLSLIGISVAPVDDQPIKIDPADFKFETKISYPPDAVKAERAAHEKKLREKYEGKLVRVSGRLILPNPRQEDAHFSLRDVPVLNGVRFNLPMVKLTKEQTSGTVTVEGILRFPERRTSRGGYSLDNARVLEKQEK